jgi:adenosylhomocysteine nucleosidase
MKSRGKGDHRGAVIATMMTSDRSAVGYRPQVVNVSPGQQSEAASPTRPVPRMDVGIITVLSVEMRPVVELLKTATKYRKRKDNDGARFHEGCFTVGAETARVVATRAVAPGQRSALAAFERLRQRYSPSVVVLVGIAGGIHGDLRVGDVAVSTEVIYYDMRKEGPDRVQRRGDSQPVPVLIRHAINDFFDENGQPCRFGGTDSKRGSEWIALPGPIGSGEAVVACSRSEIRSYIAAYNDKALAVETELGGVAQGFYEAVGGDSSLRGWLTVRGISDHADAEKNDADQAVASRHAAAVLEGLLPYLVGL